MEELKFEKCERCGGTGKVMLYPHYSKPMPKKVEYPCEECNGKGKILIIPDGYCIKREIYY